MKKRIGGKIVMKIGIYFLLLWVMVFVVVGDDCGVDVGDGFCGVLVNSSNTSYVREVNESTFVNGSEVSVLVNKTFKKFVDGVEVKGEDYVINNDFGEITNFDYDSINVSEPELLDAEVLITDLEKSVKKDFVEVNNAILVVWIIYLLILILLIAISFLLILFWVRVIKKFLCKKRDPISVCQKLLSEGFSEEFVESLYDDLVRGKK